MAAVTFTDRHLTLTLMILSVVAAACIAWGVSTGKVAAMELRLGAVEESAVAHAKCIADIDSRTAKMMGIQEEDLKRADRIERKVDDVLKAVR